MTVILFENEESESENQSTDWQTKISKSGDIDNDGEFIIWTSAEITGINTNRIVQARVLIDGIERTFDIFKPVISGLYRSFSSMGLIHLSMGNHSVEIQFACYTTPQIAKMRRARILVMKH